MENCLFCKIIQGQIPSTKVYEDESVLAFRDIAPQAPIHILVIPKSHYDSVRQVSNPDVLGTLMIKAAEIAQAEGLDSKGYRLVCNTGQDGGQTVDHLHIHLLGGRVMTWPPG